MFRSKLSKIFKNQYIYPLLALSFILGIILSGIFFYLKINDAEFLGKKLEDLSIVNYVKEITSQNRIEIDLGDDPAKGPEDAKVRIVEFSDFECPYCRRYSNDTYLKLMAKYGNDINYVFKDYPLAFHENAMLAAQAANCANDQGSFWEMHDLLFSSGVGKRGTLEEYASILNLDMDQFNKCLDTEKYKTEIEDDLAYGQSLGITGTPGFFINGLKIEGALPFEVFEQIIIHEARRLGGVRRMEP